MTWNYLQSEPFFVRHAAAVWYLSGCALTIEFGGGDTPLHRAHNYQWPTTVYGDYGFVALGIDPSPETDFEKLADTVKRAHIVVLEAAIDWPHGERWLDTFRRMSLLPVRYVIDFDLSRNTIDPQSNGLVPRVKRRMIVL